MSRSYAREVVLKTIFQLDFYEYENSDQYIKFINKHDLASADFEYAQFLTTSIFNKKNEIDGIINKFLVRWDTKRINQMELAILRLAVYEILHVDNIPAPVSINEAINFTVKYCDLESVKYINAVLEKIAKEVVH